MTLPELLLIRVADAEIREGRSKEQDNFSDLRGLQDSFSLFRSIRKPFILDLGNTDLRSVLASIGLPIPNLIREVSREHLWMYFQPEIAKIHSQNLYRESNFYIQGVYVVKSDGLLLSYMNPHHDIADIDLFGSMLAAIKDFVQDTFPGNRDIHLTSLTRGKQTFLIESEEEFFLVVVGEGEPTDVIRDEMKAAMYRIRMRYATALENFDGKIADFDRAWCEFFAPTPLPAKERRIG